MLSNIGAESRTRGAVGLEHPTPMVSTEQEAERGAAHLNAIVHQAFSLPMTQ